MPSQLQSVLSPDSHPPHTPHDHTMLPSWFCRDDTTSRSPYVCLMCVREGSGIWGTWGQAWLLHLFLFLQYLAQWPGPARGVKSMHWLNKRWKEQSVQLDTLVLNWFLLPAMSRFPPSFCVICKIGTECLTGCGEDQMSQEELLALFPGPAGIYKVCIGHINSWICDTGNSQVLLFWGCQSWQSSSLFSLAPEDCRDW
jgi:hypothetical protein